MKSVMVSTFFFLLVFISAPAAAAETQKIEAPSSVRSATVFTDRAMVDREFKHNFEPGKYSLEFLHLPLSLLDESIRVSGKGLGEAKILSVKVKQKISSEPVQEKIKEMVEQLAKIEKEINTLSDQVTALEKREELLTRLVVKTTDAISNEKNPKPLTMTQWKEMMDFLENQLVQLSNRKRELTEMKKKSQDRQTALNYKIDRESVSYRKSEKMISVEIEVKKAGSLTVDVSYIVTGASWWPVYDLRIPAEKGKASLVYSAMVTQNTGEDWENVLLTLSTAKPVENKTIPRLAPLYMGVLSGTTGDILGVVSMADDGFPIPGVEVTLSGDKIGKKVSVSNQNGEYSFRGIPVGKYGLEFYLPGFNRIRYKDIMVYGGKVSKIDGKMTVAAIQEQVTVTGQAVVADREKMDDYASDGMVTTAPVDIPEEMEVETARVSDQAVSASFSIQQENTVPSGSESQKVTIAIEDVSFQNSFVAVPRLSEYTFLETKVKNITDYPLLPGNVNIFYDGMFVNKSVIPFISTGEEFEMPIGVDEAIKIVRSASDPVSKKKGILKKKINVPQFYKITVRNLRKSAVEVNVLDQIPVSKSKEVKITIKSITPDPLKDQTPGQKKNEEKGLLKWTLKLGPNEEKSIEVQYEVEYPGDAFLEEWNGEAK